MKPRFALCLALTLAAGPALATGDIRCESADGGARVAMAVGHVPVLAILSARIEAGGRAWSTDPATGEQQIAVGQGFRDAAGMAVDFTDPNVETVLAELRTRSVSEGRQAVETGWLRLPGIGVWAVTCAGD